MCSPALVDIKGGRHGRTGLELPPPRTIKVTANVITNETQRLTLHRQSTHIITETCK